MTGVVDVVKREDFLTHDDYQKAYQKEWVKKNKEKIQQYQKDFHLEHREERNQKFKKQYYGERENWYKEYRARPEVKQRNRDWNLQKNYGITQEDFQKLLEQQNFSCAICHHTDNGGKEWHVDHCHKTGKVRGLLCNQCNRGLGSFKDNVDCLNEAIDYLCRANAPNSH